MRCDEFNTSDLPAHAQLEAWQSLYGHVFETSPLESGGRGFIARNRAWSLGGLVLNHVSAPGLSVVRTRKLIRREPVDHWAITLSKRQVTHLSSGNESLAAQAGQPFVVSLGQAMENRRDADERVQLYLSRDTFYGIATLLDASCMTSPHPSGGGRLLADYMHLLMRNLPELHTDNASRLVDSTQAMIAACLAPSAGRIMDARQVINVTLMERVRQSIRRHLRSPALGSDLICRDAGTSRSQLYRLLEGEGGVGRYVQKLRLSEAFSLLCQSPQGLTVSVIAEAMCFSDASSFARAFRREFGISPGDARAAARAGLPVVAAAADDPASKTFASYLRDR